jgi:hypothetical protein
MNIISKNKNRGNKIVLIVLVLFSFGRLSAQQPQTGQFTHTFGFGVHAEPAISWFSTDTWQTKNSGARAGFGFGLNFYKYFANNYAFSTGLYITSTGGRIYNAADQTMQFNNFTQMVAAGEKVTYKIQYLGVPLGFKFKSNQIGYLTFTTDIGIDPMLMIGGKVDITSPPITSESAKKELNGFNIGYHIMPGIEYSLGGTTSVMIGIGFEKTLLDATKDITSLSQPEDKVTDNLIKVRFGINF